MSYGIHNYNKSHFDGSNYVNGYDILYVQAAYQYLIWFEEKNEFKILNDYKEAIEIFKNIAFSKLN